jgi:ubiquinone/menaquinone biosynthesis C-methylase UbiE
MVYQLERPSSNRKRCMIQRTHSSLPSWFLEILACPVCKSTVEPKEGFLCCQNVACNRKFPIIDGIPVMLPSLTEHNLYEKAYFDEEFKCYEGYNLENWRLSYIRRIFGSLSLNFPGGECYLDIGVGGSGYTVIEAARAGNRCIGLDVSIEGIKKAQFFAQSQLGERYDNCCFVVGLAECLPFKSRSFSRLSSVAVLEHVPNDSEAISEIARVTKPLGQVFLLVPNAFSRIPPIFWLPYYLWDKRVGHLRHYKAETLIYNFSSKGLDTKQVLYSAHLQKLLQNLICRIAPSLAAKDSRIWWKLETLDLKTDSPTGLNLAIANVEEK